MGLRSIAGGLLLCGACGARPPTPEAAPLTPTPVPVAAADGMRQVQTCVVDNGRLRVVQAALDPATGDTLVEGRPFHEVFASRAEYATDEPWFVNNEPITWDRRVYTKYGPPRIVPASQLRPGGQHGGVAFFIEANASPTPEVIFVPTRPGCEFHWYQWERTTGGVRG